MGPSYSRLVLYDEVKNKAASIGMRVNSKNTQMLCIAPTGARDVSTFIDSRSNGEIGSGTELKILGFYFGRSPNADAHIAALRRNSISGYGW